MSACAVRRLGCRVHIPTFNDRKHIEIRQHRQPPKAHFRQLPGRGWRSAFHLGSNFVVTSSLTKAYGLSGIRCGWILAQPELVQRMWQVIDFTYGSPVHPAELLAVIALDNLDRVRHRARALLETNRVLVNEFLARHPDLDCEPSRFGTTVFPRLRLGDRKST